MTSFPKFSIITHTPKGYYLRVLAKYSLVHFDLVTICCQEIIAVLTWAYLIYWFGPKPLCRWCWLAYIVNPGATVNAAVRLQASVNDLVPMVPSSKLEGRTWWVNNAFQFSFPFLLFETTWYNRLTTVDPPSWQPEFFKFSAIGWTCHFPQTMRYFFLRKFNAAVDKSYSETCWNQICHMLEPMVFGNHRPATIT